MFDWPEQTQTSPTRIFLSVRVSPPALMVSSCGPPVSSFARVTFQRPWSSALAEADLAGNAHGDLGALVGPAPDRHGLPLLQDHIVADHGRQFQRGRGDGTQRRYDKPNDQAQHDTLQTHDTDLPENQTEIKHRTVPESLIGPRANRKCSPAVVGGVSPAVGGQPPLPGCSAPQPQRSSSKSPHRAAKCSTPCVLAITVRPLSVTRNPRLRSNS